MHLENTDLTLHYQVLCSDSINPQYLYLQIKFVQRRIHLRYLLYPG